MLYSEGGGGGGGGALDISVPFLDLPTCTVMKECAFQKSGLAIKIRIFKAWVQMHAGTFLPATWRQVDYFLF